MTEKIAVFGGDLFWTNLPYEALNYYEKLKNSHEHVDLILFAKDIRVRKVFNGDEKYYFDVEKYKNCPNLVTVKDWAEFYKISKDYKRIYCSCKISPKTRLPHGFQGNIKSEIVVWDIGGVDILVDSHIANKWVVKGSVWKDYLLQSKRIKCANIDDITVGSCPLYERYYLNDLPNGNRISKEEFFKKYDLKADKKTLLICPSNPGSHGNQFKKNLKSLENIIEIGDKLGFQFILKTYPHDYLFGGSPGDKQYTAVYVRNNLFDNSKPQYEYLQNKFRNLILVESQDHHESVLYSDVMFNMAGSSIAWETYYSVCVSFSIILENQVYFNW